MLKLGCHFAKISNSRQQPKDQNLAIMLQDVDQDQDTKRQSQET